MPACCLVENVLVVAEYSRLIVDDGGRKTFDRELFAEITLESYAEIVTFVDTESYQPSGKPFIDLVQALGHVWTVGAPCSGEIEHKGTVLNVFRFRFWLRLWFGSLLIFFPIRMDALA